MVKTSDDVTGAVIPAVVMRRAVEDYNAGHVAAVGPIAATLTAMRGLSQLRFTPAQRRLVDIVLRQVGLGVTHPMLAPTPAAGGPAGALQASPAAGVVVCWCPHWRNPDTFVLLAVWVAGADPATVAPTP